MELKWQLLFISVVLVSFHVAYAAEGIGMLKVPKGSISTVDTEIEATIENWGYDRIFVSLPEGWTINPLKSSAARSFPVRETGLWRIYGMPKSGKTMLGRGEVFTGKGFTSGNPTKSETTVAGRIGWWLRPNEGLLIDIYVNGIASSGVIDPLKIEKENPSIRVVKWYEVFILELSEAGFITAPWIVEGAALIESTIAPYSSFGNEGADVYYDKYQKEELDVPAWDEWFNLKNSLVYMLTKTTLAPIDLEFPSSDVEVTIKPVWRVDTTADIRYAYEWSSYQKVVGMSLWRDSALDVPDWFELF